MNVDGLFANALQNGPKSDMGDVGKTVEDLIHALEQAGPALEHAAFAAAPASALPAAPAANEARTLIEVLEWHAARHADRLHLTVLQDEATVLGALTYGELAARARLVAQGLIGHDVSEFVTPQDGAEKQDCEGRNFIAGVGAAAASTVVLASTQVLAQGSPQTGSKAMPYQAKAMPFDPKSITGISQTRPIAPILPAV